MAITQNINIVASDLTLCNQLKCGGAANRLKIKLSANKEVDAYFATYVDSNNHFRGRCTWGNNGFSFEVWIVLSQGTPTVKLKVLNCPIGLNFADNALEKFFKHINKALVKKSTKAKTGGGGFKAPQIQAHKAGIYKQKTTHNRVNHWVNQGVFDKPFGDFIKNNVNRGLRCIGT